MRKEIERLDGRERDRLALLKRNPVQPFLIERMDGATTWLVVMALFAVVDLFTLVLAVLELYGAWDPLTA